MYDINLNIIKKGNKSYSIAIVFGVLFYLAAFSIMYLNRNDPTKVNFSTLDIYTFEFVLIMLIPTLSIIVGISKIVANHKRLIVVEKLNKSGKLVKKLPYRIISSRNKINDNDIKQFVIDYTLPNGNRVELKSDPMFFGKLSDYDGCVDLVIDENNPKNYFIDLEINRLSGNRAEDYYNENKNLADISNATQDSYLEFLKNNNNINKQ